LNKPTILDSRAREMMSLFAEVGSFGLFTFHSFEIYRTSTRRFQGQQYLAFSAENFCSIWEDTVSQYD